MTEIEEYHAQSFRIIHVSFLIRFTLTQRTNALSDQKTKPQNMKK